MDLEEQKKVMMSIGPWHSVQVTFLNGDVLLGRHFHVKRGEWTVQYQCYVDGTGAHKLKHSSGGNAWIEGVLPSPDVVHICERDGSEGSDSPNEERVEEQSEQSAARDVESHSSASSEKTSSSSASSGSAGSDSDQQEGRTTCCVCERPVARNPMICVSCGASVHAKCARAVCGGAVNCTKFLCPACAPETPDLTLCAICEHCVARYAVQYESYYAVTMTATVDILFCRELFERKKKKKGYGKPLTNYFDDGECDARFSVKKGCCHITLRTAT